MGSGNKVGWNGRDSWVPFSLGFELRGKTRMRNYVCKTASKESRVQQATTA